MRATKEQLRQTVAAGIESGELQPDAPALPAPEPNGRLCLTAPDADLLDSTALDPADAE
jgi:hypothetical protein